MPLVAGQVALPQDLSNIFSGIGTNAYNRIGQNYQGAAGKTTFDPSLGGGTGTTDYQRQRLATQQGLDIGNLEAGLGGDLGNAAYKNQLAERSYGQQRQLADIIGSAMAPTELEQIFSGIGTGARAVAPWAAFAGGGGSSVPPTLSGPGSAYNIMNPGMLDMGYPGFSPRYGSSGYPDMMRAGGY